MTFGKILVALDGSKFSQVAADYAFWLSSELDASLTAQHVVDPRLVDLFVAPEFAEELGYSQGVETSEKVYSAIKRVGKTILNLFGTEALSRAIKTHCLLDEGNIVEEIVNRGAEFDLVVVGHRGRGQRRIPAELFIGSIAERVAVANKKPTLIAVQPVSEVNQILVAFDGSEPARGALLMAENLAKNLSKPLKAVTVVENSKKAKVEGKEIIREGQNLLREYWPEEVFSIKEGRPAHVLLEHAKETNSLLVVGAYGFKNPEENVLGSTTTQVVRKTQTSVLLYR
jgi:nucleotide-binding universal stress UspA family protein